MDYVSTLMPELIKSTVLAVVESLIHNWIPLSLAIITAAIMNVHINQEKVKQYLINKPKVSILASVLFGAFTPFCACGTMAVVIGMLTTTLPWGPVMAFLTSSPLMSPDGFIILAGIINPTFAVALTIASIIIGLGSGYITHMIEEKTDYLKNQTRFSKASDVTSCDCGNSEPVQSCGCAEQTCACTASASSSTQTSAWLIQLQKINDSAFMQKLKLREIVDSIINLGIKQILFFFSIFVAVGYLINYFVPTSLIMALFNGNSLFAVPLAALIGLPLYVTTESAVPLIKALMDGGASDGAMLAFMITGQATSAWVISGLTTFMRGRAIGLYLIYIMVGGILLGYVFDVYLLWMK